MKNSSLIAKYDVPVPRYTSYPTVPYWSNELTIERWLDNLTEASGRDDSSISIYVHIPFCETLCSFCGCNNSITKNHTVEDPYIETVLQELSYYIAAVPSLAKRKLKELHLGGGSPTYLSPANLEKLATGIMNRISVSDDAMLSIEVDPRRTSADQLKVLRKYNFNRISLGVQDFDEDVQRLINRIQPFAQTKFVTDTARDLGYKSVNFDLIYGLPRQTEDSMRDTIEKTLLLNPDRLAFYSYAHVPWIKAAQRLFTEDDLPKGELKRHLYEMSRKMFALGNYKEIGMDHFSREQDGLWQALQSGTLHRNFMGYTERKTDILLGLGVSAISDSWSSFHQNEKILKKYEARVGSGEIPILRGHDLTEEDLLLRSLILQLITTWEVDVPSGMVDDIKTHLQEMENDGLISWDGKILKITEKGRPFMRNACMAFDLRLRRQMPDSRIFSQSI